MLFAANQEHNETYTFKDMLLQYDCWQLFDAMMVGVNSHEDREHLILTKRKEVSMEHYVNGWISTIMAIWPFKRKGFPYGRLLKHKVILCAHVGMQKWGINYWDTYAPVVNWISVQTLLEITKIYKLWS